MIKINPVVTKTPVLKALLFSTILGTAVLPSCVNSNKIDTFEKQKTELSYSQTLKPGADPNNFKAINMAEMLEQRGRGDLEIEKWNNGNIMSKKYYDDGIIVELNYAEEGYLTSTELYVEDGNIRQIDYYYPNGNLESSNDMSKNTCTGYREDGTLADYHRYKKSNYYYKTSFGVRDIWNEVEEKQYYPNGNIKSHWVEDKDKKTIQDFYENGNLKTSITRERKKKEVVKTYYEGGQLKSKIVSRWDSAHHREYDENGGYETVGGWVETKHIEYDMKGNKIVQ